jgi:pilus assembly protein Flp/PilA
MKDQLAQEHSEQGATAVEYGLLVALIAGVIIVTVATLGTSVFGLFTAFSTSW